VNGRTAPDLWGGTAVVAQPLERESAWAGIEYEDDWLRAVCMLGDARMSDTDPAFLGKALIELYWKYDCEIEGWWGRLTMHGSDPYDRDWSTDLGVGPEVEWVYVGYPRGLAIMWREGEGSARWWRAWVPWSEDPASADIEWQLMAEAQGG